MYIYEIFFFFFTNYKFYVPLFLQLILNYKHDIRMRNAIALFNFILFNECTKQKDEITSNEQKIRGMTAKNVVLFVYSVLE